MEWTNFFHDNIVSSVTKQKKSREILDIVTKFETKREKTDGLVQSCLVL